MTGLIKSFQKSYKFMKIGIITFQMRHGRAAQSIGSSVIRGDWLAAADSDFEIWTEGKKYDAMIFQKVYWDEFIKLYDGIKIWDRDWETISSDYR